ncbi:MAG: hypothetical protein P4M10_00225 [Verrucomicrobiae bacterium]|nr:hypothetical protein [Verrucomicrobiae bacterium]
MARHSQRSGRTVMAVFLTALVLFLNALAASPSLHERLHSDAGQASHQCAATLFAHGLVDASTVAVAVVAAPGCVTEASAVEIFAFSPAIENLPAGRAPPVSPSNS